jgi:hypothetical protein
LLRCEHGKELSQKSVGSEMLRRTLSGIACKALPQLRIANQPAHCIRKLRGAAGLDQEPVCLVLYDFSQATASSGDYRQTRETGLDCAGRKRILGPARNHTNIQVRINIPAVTYELMPFNAVGDSQPNRFTLKFTSVGGVPFSEHMQLAAPMLLVNNRKRIEKIVVPLPGTHLTNDTYPKCRRRSPSRVYRNRICNPIVDYPDFVFLDSKLSQRPRHSLRNADETV